MIQPCPHPTSTAAYRSPLRALFALISASFILMMLAVWMLHRPAPEPGAVEAQIRNFSPDMGPKLAFSQTFVQAEETISGTTQAVSGFRPEIEAPRAPAGLLPVEKQAWEAMAERQKSGTHAQEMAPFFPARYSDGSLVNGKGMSIHLRPLASRGASAVIENGKIVYHEAYRSTDSLQVVADGQTEEFLLLHDAKAPQRFEYEIATAKGVKEITISNEAVHFKNASNQELTLDAPWLIDATGQRVDKGIRWEMHSQADPQAPAILALVVAKGTKLHYPVLIDPSWNSTLGNILEARFHHTATLLNNGKVLIVGGSSTVGYLKTAELYDPATGKWTPTGSLAADRTGHNATLLHNGKVLVTGGTTNGVANTAEIYDPSTGTWAFTSPMNGAHYGHASVILNNGQVLVAGGVSDFNQNMSHITEAYNPATGVWKLLANIPTGFADVTATLLPDGRVLIAGGFTSFTQSNHLVAIVTNKCQIYNPATNVWQATGNLVRPRRYSTATLLTNGKVLVAGGSDDTVLYQNKAEIYNPATGTWALTGNMHVARTTHTANLLPNGQVVVVGGYNAAGGITSVEIFNPTTGTWINSTPLTAAREGHTTILLPSGQLFTIGGYDDATDIAPSTTEILTPSTANWLTAPTGNLTSVRFAHTSTLLTNGKVLVAGGYGTGQSASLNTAELYDPATASWSATGSMTQGRAYHRAILLPSGKVLVLGGYGTTTAINSAEIYDPSTGTWKPTGNLVIARSNPIATLLANGNVLVAGGNGANASGPTKKTEIYEPSSGTWRSTGDLIVGNASQTSTLLANGRVLVTGGTDAVAKPTSLVQIYDPLTGQWNLAPSLQTARAYHSATLLGSGKVLVIGGLNSANSGLTSTEIYDPSTNQWTSGKSLGYGRYDHTATLLGSGQVWVGGGYTSFTGSALPVSELYTPVTNTWAVMGPLTAARTQHATTLLLDGSVLVSGGYNSAVLASAERAILPSYAPHIAQPVITSIRRPIVFPGDALPLPGSGYTGNYEASGGNAGQNSPSNIPVAQVQSLVNGETMMLPVDPAKGFSSSTFTSLPITGMPTGHALATIFVNGLPSVSAVVSFSNFGQTITFPALGTTTYGQTIALGATSDSGLPVDYRVVSGPATLNGNSVTFMGLGMAILAANQPGNATTNAAAQVILTCTVTQAPQTIGTFTVIPDGTFGDAAFPIAAPTSSSGLPVTVTVKSGPATIANNVVTLTGAGAVTLAANQSGNTNIAAAVEVTTSFTVSKQAQKISFPSIGTKPFGTTVMLKATVPSGLPIAYTVTGPATLAGNVLTLTGIGDVTVTANQAGDVNYAAALPVKRTFTVYQAAQTITFGTITSQQFGVAAMTLNASASSGLAVVYTVTGPATVAGNTLTITGAGTVTVTAAQAGNANYAAATSVQQSFTVAKGDQTITFGALPGKQLGASPFTLTATASSGLAIMYTISGPATLSGNVVTITGTGQVGIGAHQAGNANYNAAPMVQQKFTVTP